LGRILTVLFGGVLVVIAAELAGKAILMLLAT
jgi:hypothetical protein